ncbi:LAFE_0A05864g1_1 [Lachancea fermentati]|uniref:LAFE_0A05864g1_1 n=1 Tax=Lachancea fermentati TaxID=4955 RepID=A0A1G4M6Y6_LACFM|nr:LAFE_0A05864g1_1 [Lachancea fermentati]
MSTELNKKLKLIIVDPRNLRKTEVPVNKSVKRPPFRHAKTVSQQKGDLPVVMHTFEGGRVEKISLSSKSIINKKKDSDQSLSRNLVIKTDPQFCLNNHTGQGRSYRAALKKPVAFVPSRPSDHTLEYANPWQSSFDFDGKKPLRPLFRIKSDRRRRGSVHSQPSELPLNTIDPHFHFSRNSLGKVKSKGRNNSSSEYCSTSILKVSQNSRRKA